jgi:uncharacterized protein (AIM24 family)
MESVDSLERLRRDTGEKAASGQRFERESERMLRIEVDGGVWLKPGAAIAYRGQLSFERLHTLTARSLVDAAMREASPLVHASGKGCLYCAYRGLQVRPVRLDGETIVVASQATGVRRPRREPPLRTLRSRRGSASHHGD